MTNDSSNPAPSVPAADNPDVLLSVKDLKVHFPIRKGLLFDRTVGHVKAVDGVSFSVKRGQTLGLVGESGCGKSTLGRGILRLVEPTAGHVHFEGQDVATINGEKLRSARKDMQMIFQDPMASLNPRHSVSEILTSPLRAHNVAGGKPEWERRIKEILDLVGLPQSAINRYPHEFSGGQRQRIGIARAVALRPKLVIADEPVSALDVSVQAQVINLLDDLQKEMNLTYVVIAHDLAVVRHISDTIGVMYLGGLVETAPSDQLYTKPMHPYTIALLSAIPVPDPVVEAKRERILIDGDLPSPANPPTGCRFHTRCPFAKPEKCATEVPQLRQLAPDHEVACHFAEEIAQQNLVATG